MNKTFQPGNKVYCPFVSTDILTITVSHSHPIYPIEINFNSKTKLFTSEGKYLEDNRVSCIFHATPENKAMLDALYGIEFETPPTKLSGSDLTRAKLKETGKPILCWVSDALDKPNKTVTLIVTAYNGIFQSSSGVSWRYAIPYTGTAFLTGHNFEE